MEWKIFFNKILKTKNLDNFLSPESTIKPKNLTKTTYISKSNFEIKKVDDYYILSDGNLTRDLRQDSFFSIEYKNWRDKRLKIHFIINDSEEYIFNSNDNVIFYYTDTEIYIFKNYNIFKRYYFSDIENIKIKIQKNEHILIDFVKEAIELLEVNTFSLLESLLKKVNDNNLKFETFDDENFIKYILNHKKEKLEEYLTFNKIELLDTYYEFKGTYKDLDLIKNINIFEKMLFKDANTDYTNFINYFLNIVPEEYDFVVKTFLKNYNLYNQLKDKYRCVINPSNKFLKAQWDEIKIGNCGYYEYNGKVFQGILFANEIIDNNIIKFRIDNYYIENLQSRYVEIINDVKGYLDYIKEIRTEDFNDVKLVIDNNAKIKINNNASFSIPGEEINFSSQKVDGTFKDCYLDYAIRNNLDKTKNINTDLQFLKDVLDERMPFYLNTYFDYLQLETDDDFDPKILINTETNFDLEITTDDSFKLSRIEDEVISDVNYEFSETYSRTEESLGLRIESKKDPYGIKILGNGVYADNSYKIMGYVDNSGKVEIKGSIDTDVIPYNNLRVGRYCFWIDDDKGIQKIIDVYVSFENAKSNKYVGRKDLVKGRIGTLYEDYQNYVIRITDNYFKYVPGTRNVREFSDIENLPLPPGIYTIKNKFHYIDNYVHNKIKIMGKNILNEDKEYVMDVKEQIFKGKNSDMYVAREFIVK